MNSKEILEKYELNVDLPDSNKQMAKRALFSINNVINLSTVYLVIKIKKILEGNLVDINDRYYNPDKQKIDTNKKCQLKKNKDEEAIHDICKRLSNYRQPLAYAAIQLFEDKNLISNNNNYDLGMGDGDDLKVDQSAASGIANPDLTKDMEEDSSNEGSQESVNSKNRENFIEKLNNYSKDCNIDTFIRISDSKLLDEDICSQIINEKNKKQKYIPNLSLNITLTKIENESLLPKRIDPSLFPEMTVDNDNSIVKSTVTKYEKLENFKESCESIDIKKCNNVNNNNIEINEETVIEIQDFLPDKYSSMSIFSKFVNNIYVYPRLLNLSKSDLKGRNIACKVMMFDSTNEAEPLNVL